MFARLFAVLSLVVWAATLVTIVLAVLHRRNPDSSAGYLFEDIRRNAVWLAFAVALFTTLGSLYLSEIAHFMPCPLCWYQRICMYPLFVALLVGGLRRDRDVWAYVLPPAVIGAVIAIYHTQLQAFPKQAHFCKIGADSCTHPLRLGVRLRVDSFHVTRSFLVHHRDDARRPVRPIRRARDRTHRRVGSRRRARPFPHEELHEQAARSPPAPKRRPQARKGRTVVAAKQRRQALRPHLVDHRRRS